jgi:hypothetical protein
MKPTLTSQPTDQKPSAQGCCCDQGVGKNRELKPVAQKAAQPKPDAKSMERAKGGSCCGNSRD